MRFVSPDSGEHVPATCAAAGPGQCPVQSPTPHSIQELTSLHSVPDAQVRMSQSLARAISRSPSRSRSATAEFRVSMYELISGPGAEIDGDHFRRRPYVLHRAHDRQWLRRPMNAGIRRGCAPPTRVGSRTVPMARPSGRPDPGKTFKGKKLASTWASYRVPRSGSQVVMTDVARLGLVRGAGAGRQGGWITLRDASRKALCRRKCRSRRARCPAAGRLRDSCAEKPATAPSEPNIPHEGA